MRTVKPQGGTELWRHDSRAAVSTHTLDTQRCISAPKQPAAPESITVQHKKKSRTQEVGSSNNNCTDKTLTTHAALLLVLLYKTQLIF